MAFGSTPASARVAFRIHAGLFPPGVTTWDGAGDNTAYQSGQAVFIANPGSVYLYLKKNDPELAKGSK